MRKKFKKMESEKVKKQQKISILKRLKVKEYVIIGDMSVTQRKT